MAIISRISQLFQADMNDLLDRLEEPKAALRQAVREMEAEVAGLKSKQNALRVEVKSSQQRREGLGLELEKIEAQLNLCLANDKTDLAKGCMRRKLEIEKLGDHLAKKITGLTESEVETTTTLSEFEAKLAHVRQKADVMLQDNMRAEFTGIGEVSGGLTVTEEEVELALLQRQQNGDLNDAK